MNKSDKIDISVKVDIGVKAYIRAKIVKTVLMLKAECRIAKAIKAILYSAFFFTIALRT